MQPDEQDVPAPGMDEMAWPGAPGPDPDWPHQRLYNNVSRTLFALPDGFRTSLRISDFRATDIFALNAALGAFIEDAVVNGLNGRRKSQTDEAACWPAREVAERRKSYWHARNERWNNYSCKPQGTISCSKRRTDALTEPRTMPETISGALRATVCLTNS